MATFCPQCGAPTTPAHSFCGSCGQRLDGVPTGDARPQKKKGTSVSVVIFGTILGVLALWYFLPGIFDSDSKSVFSSKNRRSPVVDMVGPRTLVDKTVSVNEDHYVGLGFAIDTPSRVTVILTLKSGPQFETYVMDRSGYEEFDEAAGKLFGGRFHHFPDLAGQLSKKDSGLRKSSSLAPGSYYVLLDNSDFGDVTPPMNFSDDAVQVHVKVTAE